MNFYGVGVKFGGVDDKLPIFLENNFWVMGFNREEKEKMSKTISEIKIGDILFAKAYANTSQHTFPIRAIGIVTDTCLPDDIPEEYKEKIGVSVIWIKHFEKMIHLSAKEYRRGTFHTATVFKESNDDMIFAVKQMMKFDYSYIEEKHYIKLAKTFVLYRAKTEYDGLKITECANNDVKIEAGDTFGRKILLVPIIVDETIKYSLILLVPDKERKDDPMSLINVRTEFLDDTENLSERVSEMKKQTSWGGTL